jgi:hypothetical protein
MSDQFWLKKFGCPSAGANSAQNHSVLLCACDPVLHLYQYFPSKIFTAEIGRSREVRLLSLLVRLVMNE